MQFDKTSENLQTVEKSLNDDEISNFEAVKFSDLIKQQSVIQKNQSSLSNFDDDSKSQKSDLTALSGIRFTSAFLLPPESQPKPVDYPQSARFKKTTETDENKQTNEHGFQESPMFGRHV